MTSFYVFITFSDGLRFWNFCSKPTYFSVTQFCSVIREFSGFLLYTNFTLMLSYLCLTLFYITVQESDRELIWKYTYWQNATFSSYRRAKAGGRIPRKKKKRVSFTNLLKVLTILKFFVGILHTFKYTEDRFVLSIVKIWITRTGL